MHRHTSHVCRNKQYSKNEGRQNKDEAEPGAQLAHRESPPAELLLHLHRQAEANRAQDVRGPSFLPLLLVAGRRARKEGGSVFGVVFCHVRLCLCGDPQVL